MKFAILGAGGVGGYLGACLSRAGHPVALIARGAHADTMKAHGVTIQAPSETWVAHPAWIGEDPAVVGVADVVMVAAKNYDLATVLPQAAPLVGARTQFLTLQNGIQAYAQVSALYGAERTLAGLIYGELSIEAPGVIRSGIEPVRLSYGPLAPHVASPLALALAQACTQAGIQTTVVADGRAAVWSKAVFVAAMSAVTTITGVAMGPLLADPAAVLLLTEALCETQRVAEADGIVFGEDPVAHALRIARAMPATARSSMARDFGRGRPIEADALNGAIVAKGHELGVATPINQALYALLRLRMQSREG